MSIPQPAQSMPGIDKSTLDGLRQRLVEAKDFHLARIAAAEDGGEDLAVAVAHRSEAALEEVEAALAAIEAGAYGVCTACKQPVSIERMEAIPHSQMCAMCATNRSCG